MCVCCVWGGVCNVTRCPGVVVHGTGLGPGAGAGGVGTAPDSSRHCVPTGIVGRWGEVGLKGLEQERSVGKVAPPLWMGIGDIEGGAQRGL